MIWTLFVMGVIVTLDGIFSAPRTAAAMAGCVAQVAVGAAMMAGSVYFRHVGF